MLNNQNSRRKFLGSLAILTAGTAFGSATKFFPDSASTDDLETQWKQFCRQHGGQNASLQTAIEPPLPNTGHWHEEGKMVYFSKHNLLAQPTWVYWSEDKRKPADVIITFYDSGNSDKKLFRLNRFEWEAFRQVSTSEEEQDVFALMKETCSPRSGSKKTRSAHALNVGVKRGKQVSITAKLSSREISIRKQFNYSV